jgi:hypothetical protein
MIGHGLLVPYIPSVSEIRVSLYSVTDKKSKNMKELGVLPSLVDLVGWRRNCDVWINVCQVELRPGNKLRVVIRPP